MSHRLEWTSARGLKPTNAGEGVERREPSYSDAGNVDC